MARYHIVWLLLHRKEHCQSKHTVGFRFSHHTSFIQDHKLDVISQNPAHACRHLDAHRPVQWRSNFHIWSNNKQNTFWGPDRLWIIQMNSSEQDSGSEWRVMHDKLLKKFSRSDSSTPDVSFCYHLNWFKELMGDIFKKLFWRNICKMPFSSVCLVFHPRSALLHSFWMMAGTFGRSPCRAMWETHLNFKGCDGSALNGFLGQGTKKREQNAPGETRETFWEERSTVVKAAGLHSCLHMDGQSDRCPPATCRLSLHCGSASNQSTDCPFPSAHCIFYIWSLSETCTFPLGLTEMSECLCTVLPTVVHLCCTRAWWGLGDAH